MRVLLTLAAVVTVISAARAGNSTSSHRDCDLLPGDFGKPVVVAPMPGSDMDPWCLDDPDIIIDDNGPSDDDEGIIYLGSTPCVLPPVKKHVSHEQ